MRRTAATIAAHGVIDANGAAFCRLNPAVFTGLERFCSPDLPVLISARIIWSGPLDAALGKRLAEKILDLPIQAA
jgi:hypothetical protein